MNLPYTFITLGLLAMLLTVGGCDRKVMAPGTPTGDLISQDNYPRVVAQEGLADYLSVGPANVRGSDTIPMNVQVPIRLRSDKEVNIQYQFQFFDDRGRLIDSRSQDQWTFRHLPSRAQFFLDGAAMSSKAKDWRLVIRPAR